VAGAARVDGVISRLPGIGNCTAGPERGPPPERGPRRNADPAGTRTRRAADPAACTATEDWLRTTGQREIPEKGPKHRDIT